MSRHFVCRTGELPPGGRKIVEVAGRSIGVFNIGGEYFALKNSCPHQQAPLCEGKVTGTTEPARPGEYRWCMEGRILRCPWHGWEFDIASGRSVFNPHRVRVKAYPVTLDDPAASANPTADPPAGRGDVPGAEPGTDPVTAPGADPGVETYPVTVSERGVYVEV